MGLGHGYAQDPEVAARLKEQMASLNGQAAEGKWSTVLSDGLTLLEAAQRNNVLNVEADCYLLMAQANEAVGLEGATLVNLLGAERVYADLQNTGKLGEVHQAMGRYYQLVGGYSKAIENLLKARRELPAEQRDVWQVPTLRALARAYQDEGDLNNALSTYETLKIHYETIGDEAAQYPVILILAGLAYELGQRSAMLRYTEELRAHYDRTKDVLGLSTVYNNLGFLAQRSGDTRTAADYFNQSLEIIGTAGQVPPELQARIWVNAGVAYTHLGLESRAEEYYRKALKVWVEAERPVEQAEVHNYLAASSYVSGKPLRAQEEVAKALALAEPLKANEVLAVSYQILALLYTQAGNEPKATEYETKHRNLANAERQAAIARRQEQQAAQRELEQAEQSLRQQLLAQRGMVQEQERQENQLLLKERELALLQQQEELQKAELLNQQLEADRAQKALALARQTLEAERQQRQLAQLEQERKAQQAELERQALEEDKNRQQLQILETQNALQTAQIERQETVRKLVLVGGILGLLVMIILGLSIWLKQRDNKKLKHQQVEIQEKNEELRANQDALEESNGQLKEKNNSITSSITYAQRIQEAMLPSQFVIREHLPASFILFRPRDIVSGDFFWFAEKDDRIFVAAVDCTGHGVPGAFMSMIGTQLLNDLVNKRELTHSDEILNELHDEVMRALKQEQTQNNDGMDMALCVIDKQTHQVEFSGAKNPLVYMQQGEVTVIKGDRYPIGGSQISRREPYQRHVLDLDETTTFYIYSDGYQDQYGGPDNKKFMTRHFRELLHRIHTLPMNEQLKELEKALDDWQGERSQVDDVLVMGFTLEPKAAGQKAQAEEDERAA